jgi:hypothetical protein
MAVSPKDDYFTPDGIYNVKVYYYDLAASFDIDWLVLEIPIILIIHIYNLFFIFRSNDYNTFYFYAGVLQSCALAF